MSDGDLAEDHDCWFRVIIDARWVNADGTISEQALKNRAIAAPTDANRPWSHELSGRLLSLTSNISVEGDAFVAKIRAKQKKPSKHLIFSGVVYGRPHNLRDQLGTQMRSDVVHTPISPPDEWADPAHADFVIFGASTEDDLDVIRTFIQDRTKVATPAGLGEISALCASPASVSSTAASAAISSTGTSTILVHRESTLRE